MTTFCGTLPTNHVSETKQIRRGEVGAGGFARCPHRPVRCAGRLFFAAALFLLFVTGVAVSPSHAQFDPEEIYAMQNLGCAMGYSCATGNVDGIPGDELILGAVFDDGTDNTTCNSGSVTVIKWTGTRWQLVMELFNPDGIESTAFGYSVASGDLNDDDIDDVVVGAPLNDPDGVSNAGSVFFWFGTGSPSIPLDSMIRVEGEKSGDLFGTSVAITGDIDGDGRGDVVVGAPRADFGGTNAGRVYGFQGFALGIPLWVRDGLSAGEQLGRSLDGFGKVVSGPTSRDVLAGGPKLGTTGVVRALDGGTGDIVHSFVSPTTSTRFGEAVRFAQDLDGDGLSEMLVGAPDLAQVSMFRSNGTPSPAWTIQGPPNASDFGSALTLLDDLDQDGRTDFAVGAPGFGAFESFVGRVYVYDPRAVLTETPDEIWIKDGSAPGDRFGFSLASGDIRQSDPNRLDLVVGAPFATSGIRFIASAGEVTAFEGADLNGPVLAFLAGTYSGTGFGSACAFIRRFAPNPVAINDDLAIGMPAADLPAPLGSEMTCGSGAVFVYDGESPGPSTEPYGRLRYSISALRSQEQFGEALASVENLTAIDGNDDYLVVGAPASTVPGLPRSGVIRLFDRTTGAFLLERSPYDDEPGLDHSEARYGASIARLGEFLLDAPTGEEIAVGAPGESGSTGKVYIYTVTSGPTLVFRFSILGKTPADQFGFSVGGAGDMDGLGATRFVVGAPFWDNVPLGLTDVGQAYMYRFDSALGTVVEFILNADPAVDASDDHFGWSVAGAANIGSPAAKDVVVGVPGGGSPDVGRVELFAASGVRTATLGVPDPSGGVNQAFGFSLAMVDLPDTARDGFIVGAPSFIDGTGLAVGRAYRYINRGTMQMTTYRFTTPILPPPLDESGSLPRFGHAVAHSPNTTASGSGRAMIAANSEDFIDDFDYRAAVVGLGKELRRRLVDLGRVHLWNNP